MRKTTVDKTLVIIAAFVFRAPIARRIKNRGVSVSPCAQLRLAAFHQLEVFMQMGSLRASA
jgi:hypothetical protein